MKKIVFLTEDEGIRSIVQLVAGNGVYRFIFPENLTQTIASCDFERNVDLVVVQQSLLATPDKQANFLRLIKTSHPKTPVWMMSGSMTPELADALVQLGFNKAFWCNEIFDQLRDFLPRFEMPEEDLAAA